MPCNQFPPTRRRKARGRLFITLALVALALAALPAAAFAGTDTAGNVLATDNDSNPSGVEGDLYWAGQNLDLDDASIDRDIIAAGDSLSIRDCTVGGAVRLAARTIDIAKTTIDGSVTVAGQHVVLNTDSTANCFYAAGETVALRGSVKSAALAGDTVTIDGTVDGDVEVWVLRLNAIRFCLLFAFEYAWICSEIVYLHKARNILHKSVLRNFHNNAYDYCCIQRIFNIDI